ncbi:LOW QUALITY PROTEIN: hypothetical protein KUTeg_006109 [Tegillarca granosa]|uniref:Uncharacterized protein n=1 Tax=Tegillarca granosa TaxID=220873 RepID=A0ABQ9FK90_TEGGR|nr:LOW QUALITY PROTEIN: hypothetical protein KUTeg_006109 [Tegillarca granosa]
MTDKQGWQGWGILIVKKGLLTIDLQKRYFCSGEIPRIPNMGGEVQASSNKKQLYTPFYPSFYPGVGEIAWIIRAPGRHLISIEVMDVNMCGSDQVFIKDGDNPVSNILMTLTSSSVNGDIIISTGQSVYVYLMIEEHFACRGVLLSYKTVLAWAFTVLAWTFIVLAWVFIVLAWAFIVLAWEFIVFSLNMLAWVFIVISLAFIVLAWVFIVLAWAFIVLAWEFIVFSLNSYSDILGIYSVSLGIHILAWVFIVLAWAFIVLAWEFIVFSLNSYSDILGNYSVSLGCDFDITSNNGTIKSPAHGVSSYPPLVTCTWLIKSESGRDIKLTFEAFDLDTGDFVQVYQGENDQGVGFYSGLGFSGSNSLPTPVTAANGALYVVFKSRKTSTHLGFRAVFSSACQSLHLDGLRVTTTAAVSVVECNTGYYFDQPYLRWTSVTLTCQSNGQYDKLIPKCVTSSCPQQSSIINGGTVSLLYGDGTSSGSVLAYSCDDTFELVGVPRIVCQSGTWSQSAPACSKKKCYAPKISNGFISTAGPFMEGDLLTVVCNSVGYEVNGTNPFTCSSTANVPTCINKNECVQNPCQCLVGINLCVNSSCVDTVGSYYCNCPAGHKYSQSMGVCEAVKVPQTYFRAIENEDITLFCEIRTSSSLSSNAYTVNWSKDGNTVDRSQSRYINGNSNIPSLTISSVVPSDTGVTVFSLKSFDYGIIPSSQTNISLEIKILLSPEIIPSGQTNISLEIKILLSPEIIPSGQTNISLEIKILLSPEIIPSGQTNISLEIKILLSPQNIPSGQTNISLEIKILLSPEIILSDQTNISLEIKILLSPEIILSGQTNISLEIKILLSPKIIPSGQTNISLEIKILLSPEIIPSGQTNISLEIKILLSPKIIPSGQTNISLEIKILLSPQNISSGAPVVEITSTSFSSNYGGRIQIPCSVSTTLYSTVTWYFNGTQINTDISQSKYNLDMGNRSNVLLDITSLNKSDIGYYQCWVTNNAGTGRSGFTYLRVVDDGNYCNPLPCNSQNFMVCASVGFGEYTCTCREGYYGKTCSDGGINCDSFPCQHGSTCTDNNSGGYTCTCLVGWTGPNCDTFIDQCTANPCQNSGTCLSLANDYVCLCTANLCQNSGTCLSLANDYDYLCTANLCQNSGTCLSLANDYVCICTANLCQNSGTCLSLANDYDYLCTANLCQNSGTCLSLANDYVCLCTANLCQNSGTCLSLANDYVCLCTANLCQNSGTCLSLANDYVCLCTANLCQNSGTCLSLANDYVCLCTANLCQNSGTCLSLANDYVCLCTANLCQNSGTCLSLANDCLFYRCTANLCQNSGTCLSLANDCLFYRCTANLCQNSGTCLSLANDYVCLCTANLCQNSGTCLSLANDYVCLCTANLCQNSGTCLSLANDCLFYRCTANLCQNSGTCLSLANDYVCLCTANLCQNSGTCLSLANDYVCLCTANLCQNSGTCLSLANDYVCLCTANLCQNSGTCLSLANDYVCLCTANLCQNSGTCLSLANDYVCLCTANLCQSSGTCLSLANDYYKCTANLCQNSGTCLSLANDYVCLCTANLCQNSGTCLSLANDYVCLCTANLCQNSGTCLSLANDYVCLCTANLCQNSGTCLSLANDYVYLCTANLCQNSGTCLSLANDYVCLCTANLCQNSGTCLSLANDYVCLCTANLCQNSGTCLSLANDYVCLCTANLCQNSGTCLSLADDYVCLCTANLCQNSGTCLSLANDYVCLCTANLCQNSGTCLSLANDYVCLCTANLCQNSGTCLSLANDYDYLCTANLCQNSGTCLSLANDYVCLCTANLCQNSGTCFSLANDYVCLCTANLCQNSGTCLSLANDCLFYRCTANLCQNSGTCLSLANDYVYLCTANLCQNSGTCLSLANDYVCLCTANLCQNSGTCLSLANDYDYLCTANLCQNSGTCLSLANDYVCLCTANLCQNSGTCLSLANDYVCLCTANLCQNSGTCLSLANDYVYLCTANLCQNSGTCLSLANDYDYLCTSSKTGKNCDQNYNPCSTSNPCVPSNVCVVNRGIATCDCSLGTYCSTNIDECTIAQCPSNSLCIDITNGYWCKCNNGLMGQNCDKGKINGDLDLIFTLNGGFNMDDMVTESALFHLNSQALTISLWFRFTSVTIPGTIFTLYGLSSKTSTPLPILELTTVLSRFLINGIVDQTSFSTNLKDGAWHHFFLTWDGQISGGGRLAVYLDNTTLTNKNSFGTTIRLPTYFPICYAKYMDVITKQIIENVEFSPLAYVIHRNGRVLDYNSEVTKNKCIVNTNCTGVVQDSAYPSVQFCPSDQLKVTDGQSTTAWIEATFSSSVVLPMVKNYNRNDILSNGVYEIVIADDILSNGVYGIVIVNDILSYGVYGIVIVDDILSYGVYGIVIVDGILSNGLYYGVYGIVILDDILSHGVYGIVIVDDILSNGVYGIVIVDDILSNGVYGIVILDDILSNGVYGIVIVDDILSNGVYGIANVGYDVTSTSGNAAHSFSIFQHNSLEKYPHCILNEFYEVLTLNADRIFSSCSSQLSNSPVGGTQTCIPTSTGQRCTMSCPKTETLTRESPVYHSCSLYSMYGSEILQQKYVYPACADFVKSKYHLVFTANFTFNLAACNGAMVTSLQTFLTTRFQSLSNTWNSDGHGLCGTDYYSMSGLTVRNQSSPLQNTLSIYKHPNDILIDAISAEEFQFSNGSVIGSINPTSIGIDLTPGCYGDYPQLLGLSCEFFTKSLPLGVKCGTGTYHDESTSTCLSCPFGQYQNATGTKSCKMCTSGYTTYVTGATSLTSCYCKFKLYAMLVNTSTLSLNHVQIVPEIHIRHLQDLSPVFHVQVDIKQKTKDLHHPLIVMTHVNVFIVSIYDLDPAVTTTTVETNGNLGAATGESFSLPMIIVVVIGCLLIAISIVILVAMCCCRDRSIRCDMPTVINSTVVVLVNYTGLEVIRYEFSFIYKLKIACILECIRVKHIERAADLQAVRFYLYQMNFLAKMFYLLFISTECSGILYLNYDLILLSEIRIAQNVQQRKRYVNIVDKVKESCGDVKIFSSLHVTGEQLGQLSGIAAILRFPMHDNESDSDEDN